MTRRLTRRQAIQGLGIAGAAMVLRIDTNAQGEPLSIAGQPVELRLASVSGNTVRLSILPRGGRDADLNPDGGLVDFADERRAIAAGAPMKLGQLSVSISTSASPIVMRVSDAPRSHRPGDLDRRARWRRVPHRRRAAACVRRRRPAVRSPRRGRRDAQRAGRLPASDARRPRAGAMADRHRRMGTLHSPAVRRVRSHGTEREADRRGRRSRSTASSSSRRTPK